MRSVQDRELAAWLRENLGFRRYWFWTIAPKILPVKVTCWLLNRIPPEDVHEDEE